MEHESGDAYLRRISAFIRTHEKSLAEAGLTRRRHSLKPSENTSSAFNPLGWFGPATNTAPSPPKPVVLSLDTHHLFYILMRLEACGIDIGTLDVRVDSPSRPMSYINLFRDSDKSDTLSLSSFRSSVSKLSLGVGWWKRPEPLGLDSELKYIYSSFTKLPALSIHAPGRKVITEIADEPPNENALPLDAFKNLQSLECLNVDPRTLLGWDKLAESLRILTIKKSGLEDVSDIFIGAVIDDQARREGSTSRARRRLIPRGMNHAIYVGTPLPESVIESAEETAPTHDDASSPPLSTQLSSLKWAFLKHLSLSDNALTFLPTEPLPYLTSLTHLDLSSNLLVSVPSGLSVLHNLISLNLSDNMIDSVLGIYTHLGQVLSINLSHNRLESICGLERLPALEVVDLRHNLIEESAEVGRLATLPNIRQVWVEGNPLAEVEENYRVSCFDYFWKEKKNITLDGTQPGFYEKRNLHVPPPEQMSSSRPISTVQLPPIVAVGARYSPQLNAVDARKTHSPPSSAPASQTASQTTSPHLAAITSPSKGRRKKNKRIVELEGDTDRSDSPSRSTSHTRMRSDGSIKLRSKIRVDRSPTSSLPNNQDDDPPTPDTGTQPTQPITAPPASPDTMSGETRRTRHSRHRSEYFPEPSPPSPSDMTPTSEIKRVNRRSATFSSKSTTRRARVSASVYEPIDDTERESGNDADTFRQRIEALRSDMGDGWLKVYSQSQMGAATGVTSG